jgi:translation initiation factor 1
MHNFNEILNFKNNNNIFEEEEIININKQTIKIGVKQRTTRKYLTLVSGIDTKYDYKTLLSDIKKEFQCNGAIIENKKNERVIQLNGNQKDKMFHFLINNNIATRDMIKLSGI